MNLKNINIRESTIRDLKTYTLTKSYIYNKVTVLINLKYTTKPI